MKKSLIVIINKQNLEVLFKKKGKQRQTNAINDKIRNEVIKFRLTILKVIFNVVLL